MSKDKTYLSDTKEVVGKIEWDLEDCETGDISESGKRPITADEVVIHWHLHPPTNWLLRLLKNLFLSRYGFYKKSVQLGEKSFLKCASFQRNEGQAYRALV